MPRNNETNRTVYRFEYKGQNYTIHERSNKMSDGSRYTRRFICDSEGSHRGEARTPKQAIAVLRRREMEKAGTKIEIHFNIGKNRFEEGGVEMSNDDAFYYWQKPGSADWTMGAYNIMAQRVMKR